MSTSQPLSSQRADAPNPAAVFDTLNAHVRSAALRGAIELDLFSAVARGHRTVDSLSAQLKTDSRATRILCDYLVVDGFLTKRDGQYTLSPTAAAFLDRNSPSYMGSIARFINSPTMLGAFRDVAELVRRGTTLLDEAGTTQTEYEGWVEFANCMVPLMMPAAQFMAGLVAQRKRGPIRVLDIAAGHGMFGICVAQQNPQASIVALDWQNVLRVAQQNAKQAGVGDRHTLLPGDALSIDYGTGYDVVLLTNFLHHFNQQTCVSIMRKIGASLNDGGIVLTLEFVPNADRVSPPVAATFAMTMLGTTPAGDAYTFSEYKNMWQQAGLSQHEMHDAPNSAQQLIVSAR